MFSLLEIYLNNCIGFGFFMIDESHINEEDVYGLLGAVYDLEEQILYLDFLFLIKIEIPFYNNI